LIEVLSFIEDAGPPPPPVLLLVYYSYVMLRYQDYVRIIIIMYATTLRSVDSYNLFLIPNTLIYLTLHLGFTDTDHFEILQSKRTKKQSSYQ
jgi:hypothetical protein